jgi:SAM-dependent methyltransferase
MRAAVAATAPLFAPVSRCWVCDGTNLTPFHQCRFDYREYARQDPELHAYTGQSAWLVRCRACGFGQPDRLPALPRFFDRMYDQRWSDAWIESEFGSTCKDLIFRTVLARLERQVPVGARRLLDVGAHAGRFLHLARQAGWNVEGLELNPRTAAFAASRTGSVVHQVNAHALAASGSRYGAITMTDVLEHIPEPVALLKTLARLLEPGGVIAVKVPCGRSQLQKERVLSALVPGREISLAGNFVHVNHFTPASLRSALGRAGFGEVRIVAAAPELQPRKPMIVRAAASNLLRLAVYAAARLPGGVHTPMALNLQAYAVLAR